MKRFELRFLVGLVIVGLIFGFVSLLHAQAPHNGLVAAYGLDEGDGGIASDASGNSNTGTISGAAWITSGRYGNALSFDGTSGVVTINDASSLDLSSGMTLEAWVYVTKKTGWKTVIGKRKPPRGFPYVLYISGLRPVASVSSDKKKYKVKGTTKLPLNTWAHLAATYDGVTFQLYVDGNQVASVTTKGEAIATSVNPVLIGSGEIMGKKQFWGNIDEVRIYNHALTQTEIQADMDMPLSNLDTTAPSAPSSLTATPASGTQINLSWTASTDNVGVTGYQVERCQGAGCSSFALITTATGTTYNDTGLTAGTSYTYRVRATDAPGNLSAYSNTATQTTTPPDTTPPAVSSVSPPDRSTGICTDTSMTATFGEAMNSESIKKTGNVELRDPENTLVSATVAYNDATLTVTLLPDALLNYPTTFTATIRGGSTGVKDLAGNPLDGDYTWSFSTGSAGTGREPPCWSAGDMHVHRSCGGSPEAVSSLYGKMSTQNLSVISLLADMGNGEVQDPVTDLPLVTGEDDPVSESGRILHWDAEWHWDPIYTQYPHQAIGGHIVALGLTDARLTYENLIWARVEYTWPILDWAHQYSGIAGFAHMQYLDNSIPQNLDCCTPIEYPVEVALGAADFIAEDGIGGESAIQAYYRLLNCGFRPGLAAGTDYPCGGVSVLGSLLTYVRVAGGQMTYHNWIDGIAQGRTLVSRNGHNEFLSMVVNKRYTPGDEIRLAGAGSLPVTITWTANQNLSGTIELVHNGVVVGGPWPSSVTPGSPATLTTTVPFAKSGWLAARRMDSDRHSVHTAAVFVIVNDAPIRASVADANFYVQWMDNLLEKTSPGGLWNSYLPTSRTEAQQRYLDAKKIYQQIALEAVD